MPNTQAVVTQLVTMLQGLKLADGVTPAYNTVFLGGVKDLTTPPGQATTVLPCAIVVLRDDISERHTHGGGIIDHTGIEIRSVVDYTNSTTAEASIIAIRDALIPMLQQHATLNNTNPVYNVKIKQGSGRYTWMMLQPRTWYRIHTIELVVAQAYILSGGVVN